MYGIGILLMRPPAPSCGSYGRLLSEECPIPLDECIPANSSIGFADTIPNGICTESRQNGPVESDYLDVRVLFRILESIFIRV